MRDHVIYSKLLCVIYSNLVIYITFTKLRNMAINMKFCQSWCNLCAVIYVNYVYITVIYIMIYIKSPIYVKN